MMEKIMKEKICSVAKVNIPNCSRKLKVYEIKGKTLYFCDRRRMIDKNGNPYQKPLPEDVDFDLTDKREKLSL